MGAAKRAILVLGPESSGTRLATQVLVSGGCAGDFGLVQRWDSGLPGERAGHAPPLQVPLVWRRSVPYAGYWPDLREMVGKLWDAGYTVEALVTTRDWHALARSQRARGHVGSHEEALANIRRAYAEILRELPELGVPFWMVSFEELSRRPGAVQGWLAFELRLPEIPAVVVLDANAVHYGEDAG